MSEYKCISCGEIKDREEISSCPTCGYKMYPQPYERRRVLVGEIQGFIRGLKMTDIQESDISYIGKDKDDSRFPNFDAIQEYVCGSKRTEQYFERLNQSIDQVRAHIHTPFAGEYKTEFDTLRERMDGLDSVLQDALDALDMPRVLPEITWPTVVLVYHEEPDDALLPIADDILDQLVKLSSKVRKFIALNNIYGATNKFRYSAFNPAEGKSAPENLMTCQGQVAAVLAKTYEVDIVSDGSEELRELLQCMWTALSAVMLLPVLQSVYRYRFADGAEVGGDGFAQALSSVVSHRYETVDAQVFCEDFLSEKSEEGIFSLYNKMISLDTLGIMGLDRERLMPVGQSESRLHELIGLASVKESIQKIKSYALTNQGSGALNVHMCFYGNPGTGKTEVARIVAGILHENKILPTDKVVEVDRGGLVGQYVGETPLKTLAQIEAAMGGVLFIDEAYALVQEHDIYGQEAIATLVKAMEDYRGKFCVILAGYRNPMQQMLNSNPGFRSRIQFALDFPNYSRDELGQIAKKMLKQRKYAIDETAMSKVLDIADVKRKEPNFANAREMRNILDQVIMAQNVRVAGMDDRELGLVDVNRYIEDAKINLPAGVGGASNRVLSGDEELDQLIGLAPIKRMIKKIKAYAKRNRNAENFNLHMCFSGNPGTGKTEVARILSRILYDTGVLPEAKVVETDASGLIGKYVGETAPKTHAKVRDAMGGVLFIDEAYALMGSDTSPSALHGYGEEAIAALLKDMEDHRGRFCAILAGYKDGMKVMIGANPGFASRIQFSLDFPDYTREELGEIAVFFLQKKQYEIDPEALSRVLDITDVLRQRPNFANARSIRNILDQVILNQNLRTEDSDDDGLVIVDDVEEYIQEEGILKQDGNDHTPKIGFA